jgi:hypothetical protein
MIMPDIKKIAINAIQDLPDDVTYEDIFEVIFLQQQVAIGKQQLEIGDFSCTGKSWKK